MLDCYLASHFPATSLLTAEESRLHGCLFLGHSSLQPCPAPATAVPWEQKDDVWFSTSLKLFQTNLFLRSSCNWTFYRKGKGKGKFNTTHQYDFMSASYKHCMSILTECGCVYLPSFSLHCQYIFYWICHSLSKAACHSTQHPPFLLLLTSFITSIVNQSKFI